MFLLILASSLACALPQAAPADDKQAEQALDGFKSAYKAQAESARAAAVSTLAETAHPKTLAKLSSILTSSDGPSVRAAAAKGLGQFESLKKQAATALSNAFAACSKEPSIEASILQAMGTLGEPSALATIHRALDEREPAIAKAALAATVSIKNANSLDPLIAFLARMEKGQRAKSGGGTTVGLPTGNLGVSAPPAVDQLKILQDLIEATNTSIQGITEQQYSNSADWQAWWNKNRATFKPK